MAKVTMAILMVNQNFLSCKRYDFYVGVFSYFEGFLLVDGLVKFYLQFIWWFYLQYMVVYFATTHLVLVAEWKFGIIYN